MFVEDLSVFFDLMTPGSVTATVSGQSVVALFDNSDATTLLGQMGARGTSLSGMAGTKPSLVMKTTDVPASPIGASVSVNSISYLVAAHEPDGLGVSRLELELV